MSEQVLKGGHVVPHHFENAEQAEVSSKLGLWLFLVTEILLFGGLFRFVGWGCGGCSLINGRCVVLGSLFCCCLEAVPSKVRGEPVLQSALSVFRIGFGTSTVLPTALFETRKCGCYQQS